MIPLKISDKLQYVVLMSHGMLAIKNALAFLKE
jgi:hypothetical protein